MVTIATLMCQAFVGWALPTIPAYHSWWAMPTLQVQSEVKSPFVFNDGDRVVFVGSTLIEREQKYGDWELALTLLNKDRKVTFRNLGWSGDNVWGESRNYFDSNPVGYGRLIKVATEAKPNVIIVCYGQNESFAGEKGVADFKTQYQKLIGDLAKLKARIILMTPAPFEDTKPMTEAKRRNDDLKLYNKVTVDLAKENKLELFDLFEAVNAMPAKATLTENGVHMGPDGYTRTSALFNPKSQTSSEADKIREKIVAKNELFFYRWRPQNETYLFGFRKREQGNNAVEIPQFDPLIEKLESEIDNLRKSVK